MDSSPSDEPRLTESIVFRPADGPDLSAPLRWLVRVVYTHNPFYLLSAVAGFHRPAVFVRHQRQDVPDRSLDARADRLYDALGAGGLGLDPCGEGLGGRAHAVVAGALDAVGNVGDFRPGAGGHARAGMEYFLGGLAFAVGVSEGLLRGLQIRLPSLFRLPYYLILSLFFLYPVAVAPMVSDPDSLALQWALFGFSPLAGLLFLTLLPAIRRGPEYRP